MMIGTFHSYFSAPHFSARCMSVDQVTVSLSVQDAEATCARPAVIEGSVANCAQGTRTSAPIRHLG